MGRFAFDESRYLNSFTDFEEWKEHRSFYIKSFVDPGNRLRFIESLNHGILTIDKPRTYHLTYQLADAFGNTTQLSIQIEGKEQPIPEVDTENTELFHWWSDNRFGAKGIRLTIPKGNLYDDLYFRYSVKEDSTALGATHILHNKPVAFPQISPIIPPVANRHTGEQTAIRYCPTAKRTPVMDRRCLPQRLGRCRYKRNGKLHARSGPCPADHYTSQSRNMGQ